MGEKIKALIMSYAFPPITAGAPTLMYNLCKYLPKKRFNVITTMAQPSAYDKEYVLDCDTIRLPVRTFRMLDGFKFLLLAVLNGLSLNRKGEADCFLAVYPTEFNLYAAYILRHLVRKPFIIYMHDLFSETRKGTRLYRIWKFAEKRLFSSASAIIVTNEVFEDYYSRKGIRNIVVLPSCVDLSQEHREAPSRGSQCPSRKLRIVFTGSVSETNEDAIVCFLKAARRVSDVEIIFATTSKKDYLKKFSIGFISKRECYRLQNSADVLFLPLAFKSSCPEEIRIAFPCKVLEYLAAGKPVLAIVPRGSFCEVLIERREVGIVVGDLSDEKIADAIEKLKDEKKRNDFSKNARKTALSFDARVQARKLYSIIEHVVSSPRTI